LRHELGKRGIRPLPGRATIYRMLVRNNLVNPVRRRRRREDFIAWERPEPMELWQLDIVGSVMMADGSEIKVITGVDDHARYCVIAKVVRRATGRAVCAAFVTAMQRHGVPSEVLTDNGKQFTGRFTRPRPAEVLFERICRENGITARLTKPRTPTTTGKVERFHQTLQRECLDGRVFATIGEAQAAVDAFVAEYNFDRPHQGIDDAYPADRFRPAASAVDGVLPAVRVPAGLLTPTPVPAPRAPIDPDAMLVSADPAEPVEVDRAVPPSGNLMVCQQQIWLGPARAGLPVIVWVDTDRLHVLGVDGGRIKTTASRLSQRDLARLRADGGRPGRPSPLPAVRPELPPAVEVDRLVNAHGCVNIAGQQVSIGSPRAGQRVRLRLDGILLHVIDEAGHVVRTMRCPITASACARLRGARPASPAPAPDPDSAFVDRVVGVQGTIQVTGQKVRVGRVHARKVVRVHLEETTLTVYDGQAVLVATPRHSTTGVSRYRAKHQIRVLETATRA
jgi:transposase InsO family protein